jgi:threonyl-tRNA synthetase
VGEKEQEQKQVSVRRHGEGDMGAMSLTEFIDMFNKEIKSALFEL